LTKYGIAFPRHAPPIVKYLRRRCAYGDTVLYCTVHFYLPRGRLQVWRIFLYHFRPFA